MNNVKEPAKKLNAQPIQLLITAYRWGYEDGSKGHPMRGSAFFQIASLAWRVYNDRYRAGLNTRQPATPKESDEITFLHQALDSLRAGAAPIARLTPEQVEEIERERPGEDFSRNPFLY